MVPHVTRQAFTVANSEVAGTAFDGRPYVTFVGWALLLGGSGGPLVERVGHIFHDAGISKYPCFYMDQS